MAKVLKKQNVKKKPKPKPTERDLEDLAEAATMLQEMRDQSKELTEDIGKMQGDVLGRMDKFGMEQFEYKGADGKRRKVNRQQSIAKVIDEPKLKKRVGSKIWKQISTSRLDKKKMDAAIKNGELDPAVLAACITEKPNSPFVKVT